jgi:type II secretory pathway component GspD/PulD (secretin)
LVRHDFASDSRILATINECRAQLRLRFPIRIVISDRIAAPALTGLIPARLILPTQFASSQFTPEQVRQILLHEFAHIRQGHLFLHWLTLIARCVQWFNPVIHFAAARLRHECELAADAAVLRNSTPEQRAAYGETILQVLAQSNSPSTVLALGMADRARHLKERLSALSNSSCRSYSIIGGLLCAAAAMIGLSGAQETKADFSKKDAETKIRYRMRIAECSPEMVPRILQSIGADSTLTNQPRGITNFVLTPEQTKKLELIKEMQGVDFLEAPPKDFPLGPAQIHEIEDPEITTNSPPNTQFEPTIQIKAAKRDGQSLWLGSDLIITTFLGYSTNSENIGETNRLPSFRVRSAPATNSVLLGGSLAFYVPQSASSISGEKKLPVLGDVPMLGRLFRSESIGTTNRASLIFLTASNPDGPLPTATAPRSAQSMVTEARVLIELGKFDEAEATLRRAKLLDADNPAINLYLEQTAAFRKAKSAAQGAQEAGAQRENRSGLDLLSAPSVPSISGRQARSNVENSPRNQVSIASQPSTDRVAKTNVGFIPSPEIPPSALARQKLNQKLDSIRIDNFPLSTPVDLIEVVKELNFETRKLDPERHGINFVLDKAKGRAANLKVDLDRFKIKIDPPVRDVTVHQFCDVIVRVAAPPEGAPDSAILAYSIEDYGVVFSLKVLDQAGLLTRSFRVNPNDFHEAMLALALKTRGDSRLSDAQQQLRAFLVSVGVDFPTNNVAAGGAVQQGFGLGPDQQPMKAAFFNDLTGVLFVRATLADLDAVEHAIHRINSAKPQVTITVEIYDLPKEEAAQLQRDFTAAGALSVTNEFLFGTQSEANQVVPTLPASKKISDQLKQPFLATNVLYPASQFIFANDAARKLRTQLQSAKEVDSLTMPNVTTLLGRQARVSLEETSTVVTGNSTNYIGAMEPLGWSVDIIPQSFDGHDLQVSSFATRSEFLGYEKKGDVPLPRFRIRQTGSPAKLPPGDSQAFLFPLTNLKRVPVLGDIPNLGRLFQEGEEKKYSLVLVTPYLIDSAGNRVFPKPE